MRSKVTALFAMFLVVPSLVTFVRLAKPLPMPPTTSW